MSGQQIAEALVNDLVPFAEKMLRDKGEFHPFGGYVTSEGEIVHAGMEFPDTLSGKARGDELLSALKQMAIDNSLQAVAVAANVRIETPEKGAVPTDAIRIFVEHRGGFCAHFFWPYQLQPDGAISAGPPIAKRAENKIWG